MNNTFFTSDEHYDYHNIIGFCERPFKNVFEMNEALIANHNGRVSDRDTTIHVGDFAWGKKFPHHIIERLNGKHIFIKGSHDKWMTYCSSKDIQTETDRIWEKAIQGQRIVACHYAMRTWPRSHYGTFHLFGHSHGKLGGMGLSMDVGVDVHKFYPVSFDEILENMVERATYILNNPQGKLLDCYQKALERLII